MDNSQQLHAIVPWITLPLLVIISSEVKRPCRETGKKIRHRHVDIVVVSACSKVWRFVHQVNYENVASGGKPLSCW